MPPITERHLREAYDKLKIKHMSFEQVLEDTAQRKVLVACAHQLRRTEWEQAHQRTVVPLHRVKPGTDGHPVKWATQLVYGPWVKPTTPDLFQPSPTNQPCQK